MLQQRLMWPALEQQSGDFFKNENGCTQAYWESTSVSDVCWCFRAKASASASSAGRRRGRGGVLLLQQGTLVAVSG